MNKPNGSLDRLCAPLNYFTGALSTGAPQGETTVAEIPGGPMARRPLHFIWIADCSGSMSGSKIQSLNNAIREALPAMRDVAAENPNAEVLVRAAKFSSGASWHAAKPMSVDQFQWKDLDTSGGTDMGKAMQLVAKELDPAIMPRRALPPVLVLISDGHPTDAYVTGLRALMDQPWGKKAVRIAIAIGADADKEVLRRFIGHPELEPLQANNAEDLVNFIRWASTAVLKSASSPASQASHAGQGGNVPIPPQPGPSAGGTGVIGDANDVW